MTSIVYLHGFGSSPRSQKAQALQALLSDAVDGFDVPELEGGDFFHLTMDGILERAAAAVRRAAERGPVLVIGSSLGGYAATLLVQRQLASVAAMVLVAPAFRFTERWRARLGEAGIAAWRDQGSLPFFHHGAQRDLPLGYAFYESCVALPPVPSPVGVPTAIVHGREDETVDWRGSLAFAEQDPGCELHLVRGDHRLVEPRHEALIAACARDLLGRIG